MNGILGLPPLHNRKYKRIREPGSCVNGWHKRNGSQAVGATQRRPGVRPAFYCVYFSSIDSLPKPVLVLYLRFETFEAFGTNEKSLTR